MPRWRALPEELDPEIREFVRQLRGVVDRAGLSVSDVAERTGIPRADWVRHLDGRQPPPRAAVAALARVAGVPAAQLTAMGDGAAAAWRRRAERGDGPPGAPGDGAKAGRRRRAVLAAGAGGALLLVAAAVLLARPGSSDAAPRTPASVRSAERSAGPVPPPGVRCTADGCMGRDPEMSGCAAKAVTTARGTAGDVLIEVRYSADCRAAWAWMVGADPGSQVSVSAHGHSARATTGRSGGATTPMVTVPGTPGTATACGTTARGAQGCAQPLATPVPVRSPGAGA
ncbi:DUF2690 domain-containing protein, partial [Streptomyces catenulae]|uniref:DUF2690 domain-containing protein n=1 Tax=Streptomyces catenulae TaxID=66875 RepID=A0ABV2YU39_9ACTN